MEISLMMLTHGLLYRDEADAFSPVPDMTRRHRARLRAGVPQKAAASRPSS